MNYKKTYTQILGKEQNSLLWKMSLESGSVYSKYIELFKEHKEFNICNRLVTEQVPREYLHSQSYQNSYQLACESIKSFFRAIKDYARNKHKYTSCPQFPKPDKFIQVICFKKSAIRVKGNHLLLSTAFMKKPIKVKWNPELGVPIFATINMQHGNWHLSTIFTEESTNKITGGKTLAIDLGVIRIAATFDGETTTLYNGRELMSLIRLENKKWGEQNAIRAKRKAQRRVKHSRANKRKLRGIQHQLNKIKNRKKDILHKYSRHIVDKAIDDGVSKIIIGDCRSTHDAPNTGTINNQKISQGVEQKLCKMIEYKFKRVGGDAELVNEAYTTQDCPTGCGNRHKPKRREYKCKCGFVFDRDGVGSVNIYKSKVSFALTSGRSGGLTPPRGLKYHPQLSHETSVVKTFVPEISLEPPTL